MGRAVSSPGALRRGRFFLRAAALVHGLPAIRGSHLFLTPQLWHDFAYRDGRWRVTSAISHELLLRGILECQCFQVHRKI